MPPKSTSFCCPLPSTFPHLW
ncbi:hypothetical protein F383_37247 [Gossypium arboreum]|uniref:Uncharacterized protein n=1 Tax=Gossypium arboreum TaxID=29729 RepID=A0A0B0M7D0_GOSAR|nr:hypothetical protein F383_37247 [Gossypium arboreum]